MFLPGGGVGSEQQPCRQHLRGSLMSSHDLGRLLAHERLPDR